MTTPPHFRPAAVLCDIDGVIRHWPAMDDLEREHGLQPGAFAATAFAPARLLPAITGQVTDEAWRSAIASDLAAAEFVEAWSAMEPRVDADVVALLRKVRRFARLALVSNATSRLEEDLKRQSLDDLADVVVNTSRIGVAKPDPRVFAIAAESVGVPIDQCLFIDDTESHVLAARSIGMQAIHFRGIDDLRALRQSSGITSSASTPSASGK